MARVWPQQFHQLHRLGTIFCFQRHQHSQCSAWEEQCEFEAHCSENRNKNNGHAQIRWPNKTITPLDFDRNGPFEILQNLGHCKAGLTSTHLVLQHFEAGHFSERLWRFPTISDCLKGPAKSQNPPVDKTAGTRHWNLLEFWKQEAKQWRARNMSKPSISMSNIE